ncbi:MAG: rod shape-determining protein MreC [Acidimicrobiaceae bacterium]|jgi:rod shape-determining protein MreC
MALSSRGGRSRFTLALLILTSLTVLTLDFRGSSAIHSVRNAASTVFSPVRDAAGTVFSPFTNAWNGVFHYGDIKKENERLRAELDQAQGQLDQNAEARRAYDELVKVQGITEFTGLPAVTAQVIAGPLTNFEHTVEINKGSSSGIKVGMPIVTGAGLAGRVVEVQSGRSVVKLLTDPDIVVGVRLLSSNETAILHGLGDGKPLTIDAGIEPQIVVPPDELITTSGEDRAVFPSGIPIGRVAKVELSADRLIQVLTVTPLADLSRLTFLKVLLWEPPQ